MSPDETLSLLDRLAEAALPLWDLPPGAQAVRINVAENVTYLVTAEGGFRAVLRVHRDGYHSRRAIECELAWQDALSTDGAVAVPGQIPGCNGAVVQELSADGLPRPRFLVLFEFVDGDEPRIDGDLFPAFRDLGRMAARMHHHTMSWTPPAEFERMVWTDDTIFAPRAIWGDWRDAPGVDGEIRPVLEACETRIRARLAAFGNGPDRFGLIHADMRLANLLIGPEGTRLIDFDDCGTGWFLYDFAAAISFVETDPSVPELRRAWLSGYRSERDLPAADEAEIDTFVMLRRMALLAWIGSRIDAPEPQALAPGFAAGTRDLAQRYLDRMPAP